MRKFSQKVPLKEWKGFEFNLNLPRSSLFSNLPGAQLFEWPGHVSNKQFPRRKFSRKRPFKGAEKSELNLNLSGAR